MYLSKVEIKRRKNPYEWHRDIWALFPKGSDKKRHFLFRLSGIKIDKMELILQSEEEPKSTDRLIVSETKKVNFGLKKDQVLYFFVKANPVKRLVKDRNRVPLKHQDQQIEWLKRQMSGVADITHVDAFDPFELRFKKSKNGSVDNGKLYTVCFQGILKVRDPEGFMGKIKKGIGPGKAFGCGLISLARPIS